MTYPKRLIEVDLPIKRISAHARREKSIRHGHISTLHIWWARRPLAACRAVLCASLWPDPADENCPLAFVEFAKNEMIKWSDNEHLQLLSKESIEHFIKVNHNHNLADNKTFLRQLLLNFIADFSNWDNSNQNEYLKTSRALTQSAHIALGGALGTNPLVVDPFAGGGSIPLEALRVGADAFASDLNPIPVLINKMQLEYIPKFGKRLSEEFSKWGNWLKDEVKKEIFEFYPKEKNGSIVISYIWARTVLSEAPSKDDIPIEIPIITTFWLSKKSNRKFALRWVREDSGTIKTEIVKKEFADGRIMTVHQPLLEVFSPKNVSEVPIPTAQRSSVTCPITGFTIPAERVRNQFLKRRGGASDSRLLVVISNGVNGNGRNYRISTSQDLVPVEKAKVFINNLTLSEHHINSIPNEELPYLRSIFNINLLGATEWGHLFTPRQLVSLTKLVALIEEIRKKLDPADKEFNKALLTCLAFLIDKVADKSSSLCRWKSSAEYMAGNTFGRQALAIVWDFCEANLIGEATGDIGSEIEWIEKVIIHCSEARLSVGQAEMISATKQLLPDDSAQVFFTDPPYYDSVPYADLSDFFYCWLKRSIGKDYTTLFEDESSPKTDEVVQLSERNQKYKYKTKENFEKKMCESLAESRRIVHPSGIGVVVFAHKSTEGWEAQLKAMLESGWIFTASWPIDTEMGSRLRAQGSAALASSVHLVCRPRENEDGSLIQNQVGDWRDVQEELPKRIHEWMPRLAEEGVAGADAIFACLGPALEIFSRHTKVVQAGSEREISLREYLEKVWAAVSQEALNMVFIGGDAQGLEEDARLTAMWLWTLTAGANYDGDILDDEDIDEDENSGKGKLTGGFILEYDTARKIAQGLGANLEELKTLIEVKGDKARLLPVIERANKLFGSTGILQQPVRKKKREVQLLISFENEVPEEETIYQMPELIVEHTGKTVLDRLHQAMLLFNAGKTEALKRFLVEDGAGKDDRFWKLAQSLTSLYPKGTDERRWVEALQTYKKSLGF